MTWPDISTTNLSRWWRRRLQVTRQVIMMIIMMMMIGNRCGLVWTLVVPEDEKGVEAIGVVADLSREGGDI